VVTVAAIGGLVSDMGLNKLGVREIARDPSAEGEVLGSVLLARLGLGLAAVALTLTAMAVLGATAQVITAAALISMLYFTEAALSVFIVFHVRIQQQYEAFVRVVIEAVETTLVLVLIAHQASLVQLVSAQVIAATIGVGLALALARRRLGYLPGLRWSRAAGLLREALPVGLTLLLAAVYIKIPSVLLVRLRSSGEAGLYGAAYRFLDVAIGDARIDHGVLARRRGVQLRPHCVEGLRNLLRVVGLRALEQEMLDEVRDAGPVLFFVPRSRPDPEPERHRPDARHLLGDHPLARVELRQNVLLHGPILSGSRLQATNCKPVPLRFAS